MRARKRGIAALLVLCLAGAGGFAASAEEGKVESRTEAAGVEGRASLSIDASVEPASLYLNRQYVGKLPFTSASMLPGSYLVGVEAPGRRLIEREILLAEKTATTLFFRLAPITGRLEATLAPPEAELLVDGAPVGGASIELPVGGHSVAARLFGFEERRLRVDIREEETTRLELTLEPSPFSVGALEASRKVFDPASAGALGETLITFAATNRGSARVEIRDVAGRIVADWIFLDLATWRQSFAWKGRGADGKPLPDGEYEVLLSALPARDLPTSPRPEGSGDAVARGASVRIRIDSAARARPAGSLGATPGMLLFPDPRALPPARMGAELAWLASTSSVSRSAFGLGAAASLGLGADAAIGPLALGLGAAAETSAEPAADLALSLLLPLAGSGPARIGLFARGSWSSAAEPLLPAALPGAELSAPLSLELGKAGGARAGLGLAPAALLDLSGGSPAIKAAARAGAWISGPRCRAGLSGLLALGGAEGPLSPSWPALACAEARLLLAPGPLAASAYALCDIEPGRRPGLALGLGLGLLL